MAEEPQEQTRQVSFEPVQFDWAVGRVTHRSGVQLVTLQIQTAMGIQMLFFEGEPAQKLGELLSEEGKKAAITVAGVDVLSQLKFPQNGHGGGS